MYRTGVYCVTQIDADTTSQSRNSNSVEEVTRHARVRQSPRRSQGHSVTAAARARRQRGRCFAHSQVRPKIRSVNSAGGHAMPSNISSHTFPYNAHGLSFSTS